MEPITVMSATTGLNTRDAPARLQSGEEGVIDLAVALNVDVTDSSSVKRRRGYKKRADTGGHSLYADSRVCLFVSGDSLCRLASDFSYSTLATLSAPDRRMVFQRAPDPGGDIYFSNGSDKGIFDVSQETVVLWTPHVTTDVGQYLTEIDNLRLSYFAGDIGFDEYSSGVEELLRITRDIYNGPPPSISHMEFFKGRLYVATGHFLLYSKSFDYSSFDIAQGFIAFPSRIRMIRRVPGGLYVGTDQAVFFLEGTDPREMSQREVLPDRPIEYTDVRVRASDVMDGGSGEAAMWATTQGVAVGGPGGRVLDPVRPRVEFPSGLDGAAVSYDSAYLALFKL